MKWYAHSFYIIGSLESFMHLPLRLTKIFSQSHVQKDSERTFKKFLDLQVKNIDNLIFFDRIYMMMPGAKEWKSGTGLPAGGVLDLGNCSEPSKISKTGIKCLHF